MIYDPNHYNWHKYWNINTMNWRLILSDLLRPLFLLTLFAVVFFVSINKVAGAEKDANINQSTENTVTSDKPKNINLHIGPLVYFWDYEEISSGERFIRDSGFLYGLQGRFDYTWNSILFSARGSAVYGTTDYDGSLQNLNNNTKEPYQSDSKNSILDGGFHLGYILRPRADFSIIPQVGIKTWYLQNFEQSDDPYDYDRIVNYIYAPVGLQIKNSLSDRSNLSLEAFYNNFINGTAESYLGNGVVINEQTEGEGYEFSIAYEMQLENSILSIGPFYRKWVVEDSDTVEVATTNNGTVLITEPANETKIYGLNFLFIY